MVAKTKSSSHRSSARTSTMMIRGGWNTGAAEPQDEILRKTWHFFSNASLSVHLLHCLLVILDSPLPLSYPVSLYFFILWAPGLNGGMSRAQRRTQTSLASPFFVPLLKDTRGCLCISCSLGYRPPWRPVWLFSSLWLYVHVWLRLQACFKSAVITACYERAPCGTR